MRTIQGVSSTPFKTGPGFRLCRNALEGNASERQTGRQEESEGEEESKEENE
jgi:hypothetical protein